VKKDVIKRTWSDRQFQSDLKYAPQTSLHVMHQKYILVLCISLSVCDVTSISALFCVLMFHWDKKEFCILVNNDKRFTNRVLENISRYVFT